MSLLYDLAPLSNINFLFLVVISYQIIRKVINNMNQKNFSLIINRQTSRRENSPRLGIFKRTQYYLIQKYKKSTSKQNYHFSLPSYKNSRSHYNTLPSVQSLCQDLQGQMSNFSRCFQTKHTISRGLYVFLHG